MTIIFKFNTQINGKFQSNVIDVDLSYSFDLEPTNEFPLPENYFSNKLKNSDPVNFCLNDFRNHPIYKVIRKPLGGKKGVFIFKDKITNKIHRLEGPAVIYDDGTGRKLYYHYGVQINK